MGHPSKIVKTSQWMEFEKWNELIWWKQLKDGGPLRPRKAKNEIKLMKLIWLNSCGPLGGAIERFAGMKRQLIYLIGLNESKERRTNAVSWPLAARALRNSLHQSTTKKKSFLFVELLKELTAPLLNSQSTNQFHQINWKLIDDWCCLIHSALLL